MLVRLGVVIFVFGSICALLIVAAAWAILGVPGDWGMWAIALVTAGLVFFIGRGAMYVLSDI